MKLAYIRVQIIGVLLLVSLLPLRISAANDTISTFPFSEDWGSGSFETNHWTFPYGQGNWAINLNEGNPSPCAEFTGQPQQSNYINALESEYFDARGLTCDNLYLDFDLSLITGLYPYTEYLDVELIADSSTYPVLRFLNQGNYPWTHIHYPIQYGLGSVFKIRFIARGQNSASFISWQIDNVSVVRTCDDPESVSGFSYFNFPCTVKITWRPPDCNATTANSQTFIYDDGTWEHGWRCMPGEQSSLGNYFPVASNLHGLLQSFELYFVDDGSGSPQYLDIIVYDYNQIYIGNSGPFLAAPYNQWITVPISLIPLNGPFYAMVSWANVSGYTYFLAHDENGPYAYDNLSYKYDGTSWTHLSGDPGVFLLRANALIFPDLTEQKLLSDLPDTATLTGYNLYKIGGAPSYDTIKVNQYLLTDTVYYDTIDWYDFYKYEVRAVFSDLCESPGKATEFMGCYFSIDEHGTVIELKIFPNPALSSVEISAGKQIRTIGLYDSYGSLQYHDESVKSTSVRIDVSSYPPGIYFITVLTEEGTATGKFVISR